MMKRLLIILSILLFGATSYAAELQPYAFPFTGKWNPSDPPLLIDDYGLQDIQNLRKDGKHFKGVKGHSKVNTTALSDLYVVNGFHFSKDQPQESHVIVYAGDATTPTTGHLYQNTTAVPTAGDFSGTVLYTPTTFTDTFRFSNAPGGNMVSSNAAETLIWGGNEQPPTVFITSSADITYSVTNSYDFTNVLIDVSDEADNVATLSVSAVDTYSVLLLHANGTDAATTFTDSASGGKTQTAVGDAQLDTAQRKFGTASGLFDGTGDYITSPDHADWFFDTGAFTIDGWLKGNGVHTGTGSFGIAGQYVDANNYWSFYLRRDTSGEYTFLYAYFKVVSSGNVVASYRWRWPLAENIDNTFYHVALVRSGTSLKFAVDGDFIDLLTDTWDDYTHTAIASGSLPNLAAVLEVGASENHGKTWKGWIDEFRVTKGLARWTSDFSTATTETGGAHPYFLVGYTRPLQGVKFYITNANTETSALSAWEWTGASWLALTLTDNTASGGKTLAQTGTVTWDSTVDSSEPRYIAGYSLYWYKFNVSAGSTTLSYVTVDAPLQSIKNIWDGIYSLPIAAKKYDGTKYTDYLDLVGDDSIATYMEIDSLATSNSLIFGFIEPQQALKFNFVNTKINTTAATTMTVNYRNGTGWVSVRALNDGTSADSKSFAQDGVVVFSANDATEEFVSTIQEDYPLYYYQVTFSQALSGDVQLAEVRGIPAPRAVKPHKFSALFQNRLFLFNETNGLKNVARYSISNAPDIFNGDDSGYLYFGENTDLTAAATIYNTFAQIGGLEQLIVAKKNEIYRLTGNSPENWNLQKISENVGCIAPLSMVSADVTLVDNVKRQVVMWMSDKGVHITDGSTVQTISDEIKCYFDPSDVRYIPTTMQSKSVAWYDPTLKSYKLLIASGSSATYLNTELEYSLQYKEWTKIYREAGAAANPLQSGFQVYDTNGLSYTYGGGKLGYVYLLENTNRWDGTRITSYLQTKDLLLDQQLPLLRQSTVKYLQAVYKKKQTGAITIRHFGDGVETYSGTDGQMGPETITAANALGKPFDMQSTLLGPYLYHSFKFEATTNIADGLELTGMAVYHEPYTAIR